MILKNKGEPLVLNQYAESHKPQLTATKANEAKGYVNATLLGLG